ncbi:MAG: carbohydrate-binding family 9-like protein [Myxococcota bacterium]
MRSLLVPSRIPLSALLLSLVACKGEQPKPETVVYVEGGQVKTRPFTGLPEGAVPSEASWDGRLRLLGSKVEPANAAPGEKVRVTAWFFLQKDLLEDYKLFLHGGGAGGEMNLVSDDHVPLDNLVPTSRWRPGEVLEDVRTITVPDPSPVGVLTLWTGFYRGNTRLPVDNRAHHDGQNRVTLATIAVGEGKALPEYSAVRRTEPITVDGVVEPAWEKAARTGAFFNYDGRGYPGNKTSARLMWDDEALYVLFECDDKDIWTSYTKRDDPIYNQEAVEVFLDVDADLGTHGDPNKGTYQELQAAPNDVHFDAAFSGRRQGMNPGWNSSYETKAVLRGTFNTPTDVDEGWTSEWRIPWKDLTDVGTGVKAGQRMRFNMFRLDKPRKDGRIVDNEASAWSAPLSGDFHNVTRFGWLVLGG